MSKRYKMMIAGLLTFFSAAAQQPVKKIPLPEALARGIEVSKHLKVATVAAAIADNRVAVARQAQLPDVDLHTSYARLTDLIQYQHGIADAVNYQSIYDMGDVTANARMPLYAGHKLHNEIKKQVQEDTLAHLQARKTARDVKLDIIGTYLGIYKLQQLQQLITDHIREEEARLHEVEALKRHGAVTRNEILRAELQLSQQRLALTSARNNVAIGVHRLKILLEMENDSIAIDTTGLVHAAFRPAGYEDCLQTALLEKDELQIAAQEEQIRETGKKIVKGDYFPVVSLFGMYGVNYPNYKFFPPEPYLYRLGWAGVDVSFSISRLFKNRKKMTIAQQQIEWQQAHTAALKEEITGSVHAACLKYNEYIERIAITEEAIRQASENYRIVKNKYLNQLALVTDMIDADNALLNARFDAVTAGIDTEMKYYELQFAMGRL